MLFFSDDDQSKDSLFLYLGNTTTLLKLKMYGAHLKKNIQENDFYIYLDDHLVSKVKEELGITEKSSFPFDITRIFDSINNNIPQIIPLDTIKTTLQTNKIAFKNPLLHETIDESDKIYLIGPKRLPENKSPKEKTLRKLYLYVEGRSQDMNYLIELLKSRNMTLAWSADQKMSVDLSTVINRIK
jgi:hypothetical protein